MFNTGGEAVRVWNTNLCFCDFTVGVFHVCHAICCEEFKTHNFGNVFYQSFKITFYCR